MRPHFILALTVAVLMSPPEHSFADEAALPHEQSVASGVWLIPGSFRPKRQPDGNTIIFTAPKGLIVMDTGRHVWQREAILDFARRQRQPIAAIINSHWHLDHVSGNPALKAAYPSAKVYASGAIRDALTGFLARSAAGAEEYLNSHTVPPETAKDIRNDIATFKAGQLLLPDIEIKESGSRVIAGKTLDVNLASNAATDGDVWIFDASTGVVASGDLVTLPVPFLDTACPEGWRRALAQVDATPFKILIPGHGAPMTRRDFATYRAAFEAFIDCANSKRDSKECTADWMHDVATLLPDDAMRQKAEGMAPYYVDTVLRAHGGKSAECKI
ncbi:MAG: MBL fold metallo-hydrolase [Alphaproteobacteria bacterium]|nr:MBL fold metallo-hydrolase [Alphaproteobacteria bacterium]